MNNNNDLELNNSIKKDIKSVARELTEIGFVCNKKDLGFFNPYSFVFRNITVQCIKGLCVDGCYLTWLVQDNLSGYTLFTTQDKNTLISELIKHMDVKRLVVDNGKS